MPSSSRIVFAEDLVAVAPWRPQPIDGERLRTGARRVEGPSRDPEPPPGPTYEDGLRDGFERGLQEAGVRAGQARREELEAIARRGDALLETFAEQLAGLQRTMSEELVALAVEIARSAFGAALPVRDDAVAPAVVAALGAIVDEHARPALRLHPDDATLVGEQLAPLLAARGVQIVPDPAVLPGGCLVETARGSVDATVRTRWRRALAAIGRDDDWVEA